MKKTADFTDKEMDWNKLNAFFLAVGEVDDYTVFSARILQELGKLISYDQGVAIYYSASGKMLDCFLFGVDEKWGYIYKEYYAKHQFRYALGSKRAVSNRIINCQFVRLPGRNFRAMNLSMIVSDGAVCSIL